MTWKVELCLQGALKLPEKKKICSSRPITFVETHSAEMKVQSGEQQVQAT